MYRKEGLYVHYSMPSQNNQVTLINSEGNSERKVKLYKAVKKCLLNKKN